MTEDSTIAAIATPPGAGGIGIIKISGPEAVSIATRLFRPKTSVEARTNAHHPERDHPALQSHRLYHGHIVSPANAMALDEVLLTVMRAPNSYTREDVVEIQAHAGPIVLRSILKLLLDGGARLAEPGEFTRRAFLNGRIDLTQAEAVVDLIHARSEVAIQSAARQLSGGFKKIISGIEGSLHELHAIIEAGIDFPDDVDGGWDGAVKDRLRKEVIRPIQALIRSYDQERLYRDGLDLVIVGKPNVGKSSLLNCLLGKERAIVADQPGTTRDQIQDWLNINGIPINLIDTAGLHATGDPIESLGIQKTRQAIQSARKVLWVVEGHRPLDETDLAIYSSCREKEVILVINKIDLIDTATAPMDVVPQLSGLPCAGISAKYGRGIDALKQTIVQGLTDVSGGGKGHGIIPNLRHKMALEAALESARAVAEGLDECRTGELIALDLKDTLDAVSGISGRPVEHDLLGAIFNQFCIGK
jgi:tRNA modification GTPase